MESQKQLLERLQSANNILVTVSSSPSVDQLSAAIGLSLLLNKLDKHATAVFSGETPSTIEFLNPEATLEQNTDSLRDFIIALDKSKADKLRYKVEDSHVKIFITPYRTSISEKDLVFSQGDFNVEVVVALGVDEQKDLDQAITAHGRILHDATTAAVTVGGPSKLGTINWFSAEASSLCEMIASLAPKLGDNLLDGQMATALLTGIIAETDRFRNEKTSSATMSVSAMLLKAGANQQLVADQLEPQPIPEEGTKIEQLPYEPEQPEEPVQEPEQPEEAEDPTELEIDHEQPQEVEDDGSTVHIDDSTGRFRNLDEEPLEEKIEELTEKTEQPEQVELPDEPAPKEGGKSLVLEPPTLGGTLTANTVPHHYDPSTDPLSPPKVDHDTLAHTEPAPQSEPEQAQTAEPVTELPPVVEQTAPPVEASGPAPVEQSAPEPAQLEEPAPAAEPSQPQEERQTLADLEAAVGRVYDAPEPDQANKPDAVSAPQLDEARDAVMDALNSLPPTQSQLPPVQSLNAQPLEYNINSAPQFDVSQLPDMPQEQPLEVPAQPTEQPAAEPYAPPTVPPPFMPPMPMPSFDMSSQPQQPQQEQPPAGNPFNLPPA